MKLSKITVAILAAFTIQSNAATISLSPQQIAQVVANPASATIVVDTGTTVPVVQQPIQKTTVSEIKELTDSIGIGILNMAERLGIAVERFANSWVGIAVILALFVKFFGGMMMKLIISPILFVMGLYWVSKAFRIHRGQEFTVIEYKTVPRPGLLGKIGFTMQEPVKTEKVSTGSEGVVVAIPLVIGVLCTVVAMIMAANI